MSLKGVLAPLRDRLAGLWVTSGGRNVDLIEWSGLPRESGLALGILIALLALYLSRRNRIGAATLVFASGVGFSVTIGSVTFSGPSASTLMFFLEPVRVLEFDVGLVPGVVLGAGASALLAREARFEGFEGESNMRRSMFGAVLMGFGAMLAGGCSIGAGVTGGSIFVATAWLALFAMWVGAMATDLILDQRGDRVPA